MKNMSQRDLADVLQLSRSQIASYEGGQAEPSLQNLLRITVYFEISVIDILSKDLTSTPLQVFEEVKHVADDAKVFDFALPDVQKFISRTNEASLAYEGLRELLELRKRQVDIGEFNDLLSDYDDMLGITEELLKLNWGLIDYLQK